MREDDEPAIATSAFEGLCVIALQGEREVSRALAEPIELYKRLTGEGRRLEAHVGSRNMRRTLELTSLDGRSGVSLQRVRYLVERLPAVSWPSESPA